LTHDVVKSNEGVAMWGYPQGRLDLVDPIFAESFSSAARTHKTRKMARIPKIRKLLVCRNLRMAALYKGTIGEI
jgi:hypothetical protein